MRNEDTQGANLHCAQEPSHQLSMPDCNCPTACALGAPFEIFKDDSARSANDVSWGLSCCCAVGDERATLRLLHSAVTFETDDAKAVVSEPLPVDLETESGLGDDEDNFTVGIEWYALRPKNTPGSFGTRQLHAIPLLQASDTSVGIALPATLGAGMFVVVGVGIGRLMGCTACPEPCP